MANTLSKPSKPSFYPNELDPAKKGRDYCLRFAKAMYWSNWNGVAMNAWGNPRRDDWIENRAWAIGNPNVNKYVPLLSGIKDDGGNPASFLNLDLKPVCFIPKFIDIIVSYIEKLEYDITCDAVNPEAVDVKNEKKWRIYAAKKMQAWIEEQEAKANTKLVNTPDFDFDFTDKEELDILFSMSVKLDEEMMMELGNEVVLNESNFTLMKRMILKDLATLGAAARETYVDPVTDRVKTRYIDMVNVIYPQWEFRGEIFERPSKTGYIETMTIAQLRAVAGDQFTEEQYQQIAAQFSNQFGNGQYSYPSSNSPSYINTDAQYNYFYSFNIPVMTLYWEETDRYKYQDKLAQNGETYTKPVAYKEPLGTSEYTDITTNTKKTKTVYPSDVHCYYQAKWIVGTDWIYNWGKVPDMGRNPLDPKYAICPLQIYRVSERSMLDRLLPFDEQNILAWLKMQNTIAQAIPSGFSANINTLKNATIDGKDFPVKHQVELYTQTGRLIWDSENPLDETGRPFPHPIMQLPSTLMNDIQAWILLFDSNIAKMRGASGINELMDASTPDARTLAGTAKLAVAGSQNALTPIADAMIQIQEQNCLDISEKLKLVVQRNGSYDAMGYAPALGANLIRATIDEGVCAYRYAIKVRARPTAEERMEMKEAAKGALTNSSDPMKGGLMYSDYIYIIHLIDAGTNMKLVEAIMRHRIEKNIKRMSDMAAQNSQSQSQEIKAQIEAQTKADLEKAKAAAEIQKDLDTHQTDNKIRLARETAKFHSEGQVANTVVKGQVKQQEILAKESATA